MKSLLAWLLSAAVVLYAGLAFCPRFKRGGSESTFGWDAGGYYWYLPSAFIYHDLKGQHFADSIIAKYQFTPALDYGFRNENGGYVLTYSSGMALLYAPFFTAAHLLAKPLGFPADGFSKPYQVAISLGSLLVCLLGLWYYRKLLRFYFSDGVTAIMILLLAVGTNYLNYAAIDGALTHHWFFTLYVFLLLATRAFYQRFEKRYAIAIGLLCGLATLIRPSEIISALIPLLWGMERLSLAAIRERLRLFHAQFGKLIIAALCMAAIGSIQLIYWKYVSGHWLVYSYAEKGFSWMHPHWRDYMLSYRSGWITYTPLMALCFVGIIPFLKYGRNKVAVLVFFAINLYIVSAWDIWWYGGTGGRAMIQSYPVILFPLASLVAWLLRHRAWLYVATPCMLLAAYVNIWFTVQAHGGEQLYDSEGMNKAYYWRVVGRWHVPPETERLKDASEIFSGRATDFRLVYRNDVSAEEQPIVLDEAHPYSPDYSFTLPDNNEADWLRVQARFRIAQKEWTAWKMTQFIVSVKGDGKVQNQQMLRVQRYLSDGETKEIFLDIRLPANGADSANILFWNPGSDKPVWIDHIRAWSFREAR
jgi:hypothetical protein